MMIGIVASVNIMKYVRISICIVKSLKRRITARKETL